ncbi:MAG TPA: hypothetical protein VJU61_24010 [Polyangiaceae bacterium]|nr:hypothetical protein [Polyangiaceae bacterium]
MRGPGAVRRWDAELAALARADAALRLGLGQALERIGEGGHCFALGFSSVGAYSLERCERSGRWVEGARCLVRRLESMPALRRAIVSGQLSWSAAELVARVATPETEAHWLSVASSHSVRELRGLVRHAVARARESGSVEGSAVASVPLGDAEEVACTLTCTVDREEVWLFEATRRLLEQLGEHGSNAQVEALLAEAQVTLLAALPRGAIDAEQFGQEDRAQQLWNQELQRWQDEAEARCEAGMGHHRREEAVEEPLHEPLHSVASQAVLEGGSLEGLTALELDRVVRELSAALAQQELALSRRLLEFHRADGWRQLGYATEGQYARERLGLSRSSLVARRALALHLESLPLVAQALGAGQLGVEAALQLVRVATRQSERAWVERAQQRTIKHLREEVSAALVAVRLSGDAHCPPPAEPELDAFWELERAVVSGQVCRARGQRPPPRSSARGLEEPSSAARRAWLVMLASLERWLETGLEGKLERIQMSAGPPSSSSCGHTSKLGRVALRLRVSRETHAWWRGLEAQARRWLPRGMSWLKFLCLSLWRGWRHVLGSDAAYHRVYVRDRYRCRSPVCSRQDVTPHHLVFRSAGGSDESSNVATVCSWCHLFGIHGGRIRAQGTAELIHWELGAPEHPCLVVHGRERRAA